MAKRHGHAKAGNHSPTYRAWAGMIQRCTNRQNSHYADYGGRGIAVCDRWRVFENFLADMGEKPSRELTIERKDNDGNYEPGNCRWATLADQSRNKRTSVRSGGIVLTDAARTIGLSHSALTLRVKRGWAVDEALKRPRWHKSKSGIVNRGEKHPMAKLTGEQVAAIRARLASGESGVRLAAEFGMSRSMISKIKLGQAWAA